MHSKFKTIMKVNSKIANENLVHTYSSNKNFLTSSVGLTLPEDNPSLIYFESITVHCPAHAGVYIFYHVHLQNTMKCQLGLSYAS